MARYAVLNKARNKVINIVGAPSDQTMIANEGWVLCTDTTAIDDEYANGVFSHPAPNPNKARKDIKQTVRALLRRTDWTQVPDNLGNAKQLAWKTWRQSIRDLIAASQVDPFNIVFPDPPGNLDEDGL